MYSCRRYKDPRYKTQYVSKRIKADSEEELDRLEKILRDRMAEDNRLFKMRKQKEYVEGPMDQEIVEPQKSPSPKVTEPSIDFRKTTGNSLVVFGSSKMGKSVLLAHLFKKYFKSSIATLFTINYNNKSYGNIKPIIYRGWNNKSPRYIDLQRRLNQRFNNKYRFLIMLDDIIAVNTSKIVNNLILTYRNSNISSMICLQYPRLLSKMARANGNYYAFFRFHSEETIEDAIKVFLSSYFRRIYGKHTLSEQIDLYKQLTNDHQFILLDNLNQKLSVHKINLKAK